MRKLIVSMNVTMDGFMAAADGGLEWHFRYWNDEMAEESARQLSDADTILLGRKTYEAMAAYWPLQSGSFRFPRQDIAFAEMINDRPKVVFSTSLRRLQWRNSVLIGSDIGMEVRRLKKNKGGDILIYGSGSIVRLLMQMKLIDEYRIWMHPVILGHGRLFPDNIHRNDRMRLTRRMQFSSGVELLFYKVMRSSRAVVSI